MKLLRIMLLSFMLVISGMATAFAEDVNAPQTWDVSVSMKVSADTQLFNMVPGVIYIREGDTVKFTNNDIAAPHMLGFLIGNPPPADDFDVTKFTPASGSSWAGDTMLFSPEFNPGESYSITFTKAGAYAYYCLVHPMMKGTVVVVPKGGILPSKAEQQAANKAYIEEQKKIAEDLKNMCGATSYTKNADGSLNYKVSASSGNSVIMVNDYFPEELYINAGDSVEWFAGTPGEFQLAIVNMPKGTQVFTENGVNPIVMTPSKPVYDGTGYASAGPLIQDNANYAPNFKLTFSKPGTYTVSDPLWNKTGTIVVAPKGATKITVDGKAVVTDTTVKNGHVFAPLTTVSKALGQKVSGSGKTATIGGKKLKYGSDSVPYVHNSVTYVAMDSIALTLGKSYSYDVEAKLVALKTK